MTRTKSIVRIFSPREELCFLSFPLLFLPFFFIVLYFGPSDFWEFPTSAWAYFVTSFLFLNSVHVLFTFEMLWFLDEFREFRRKNDARLPLPFVWECSIVFIICTLYFYAVIPRMKPEKTLIIYNLIAVFHTFRQVTGLGVVYDQLLLRKRPQLKERIAQGRRKEKAGQAAFLILILAHSVAMFTELPYGPKYKFATFCLGIAFCLYIYAVTLVSHKFGESNKGIYLARIFFYPLSFVDLPSSILVAAFHGVEYYFVYRKLKARSSTPQRSGLARHAFWIAFPIFSVMIILRPAGAGIGWMFDPEWYNSSWFIGVSNAVYGGLLFMHFYVDSRIYNMKNAAVREHIGPLLLGENDIKG